MFEDPFSFRTAHPGDMEARRRALDPVDRGHRGVHPHGGATVPGCTEQPVARQLSRSRGSLERTTTSASASMSIPNAKKRIRLLIADDVRLFRDALAVLLATQPSFEIVGYAANGDDTIPLAAQLKPDVLLLDLVMPHMGGIETL